AFPVFSCFFHLQAVAFQRQPPIRHLQKKSCLKHYRRFFVRPAMCHHRPINVAMTVRNEKCPASAALCRRPGLLSPAENPPRPCPSYRPHWSHPSFLDALLNPENTRPQSHQIVPNRAKSCQIVPYAYPFDTGDVFGNVFSWHVLLFRKPCASFGSALLMKPLATST